MGACRQAGTAPLRLNGLNRDIVETVILPEFASWPDMGRVLFVGVRKTLCRLPRRTARADPAISSWIQWNMSVDTLSRHSAAILLNGVFGVRLGSAARRKDDCDLP
jgi:hypothetical protein